ncbi:MAG TPA: hypothetical protein VE545_08160 [Candidatus Dormibacteraeota bacterium]|nr:hypothetical protein [Candidatus Dormibacteraeota bacterium]
MNRNIWMKATLSAVAGAALILSAGVARAQGPRHGGPGIGGPGGAMELLGFEGGPGGKVVKGAPFSASATSDTSETLSDGTVIHRTAQITLARDSQGRSRRELTTNGFGPLAASGEPKKLVMISDPVAGFHYMLKTQEKIAEKMPIHVHADAADSTDNFHKKIEAEMAAQEAAGLLKKESLGTQTINGVSAEGTRITKIIPAGKIGNDRAINIVSERWYSPDLQIVVKSTRSDPQSGTTTYQVTNIQKAEPAATLFAVPSDFTVQQGRGFGRGRGHGGPGAPGADVPPPPPTDQ